MTDETKFPAPSANKAELEAGTVFSPRFDESGLITVVVTEHETRALLMVAYMDAHALEKTLETGVAHYWSRSRNKLWRKGEESGNTQTVVEVRTDCDQDVIELRVSQKGDGVACHTGRHSCFYRVVETRSGALTLTFDDALQPKFDPPERYKDS